MRTRSGARRRFFERRGLTTLSLNGRGTNGREPARRRAFANDPELTVTDIWLRRLAPAHDGLRIVHLTDIHHSLFTPIEEVERAVQLANRQHPDLVALTGDYVTFSPDYISPMARSLGKLRARLGVYAVLGNHDFQVDAERVTRALRAHDIQVLRNAHRAVREGGSRLWLVGVDDIWWGADDLPFALRSVPAADPKILLCHNPLGIRRAAAYGIDFMLSGHTHGGQVRLPLVGSVRGRSKLGERFIDGWNRFEDTQIYVNRGIGKVVVPVRVGCPPEIACLRLRQAGATRSVAEWSDSHRVSISA